jgi:hypothetical protein
VAAFGWKDRKKPGTSAVGRVDDLFDTIHGDRNVPKVLVVAQCEDPVMTITCQLIAKQ